MLKEWARELGFADIGVTDVDLSDHEPHVRNWLAAGFAGDMGYLQRNLEKRLHPDQLVAETCRVICARMDYLVDAADPIQILHNAEQGYVSRYALGRDYHKVLRRRLAKLAQRIDAAMPNYGYRAFTDSAPVLEKALAQKAGMGWMGKHSLILNNQAGSWFFLGEIYTNAPFPVDSNPVADQCGKCTACMTVCPTNAIIAPKTIAATRCISYLTIEHQGSIPIELRPAVGNRIYGCDDCQLFCPWNRQDRGRVGQVADLSQAVQTPEDQRQDNQKRQLFTSEPDFQVRHELDQPNLLTLFKMDKNDFLAMTEGSAMRRIGYDQWQRNLAVAIGNGPASHAATTLLQDKLAISSPMVAEHIQWALKQLAQHAD